MSVNQKRAYSTPSFSICFSACLRASGLDVARSLLSIMPIVSLAPLGPGSVPTSYQPASGNAARTLTTVFRST